MTNLKNIIIVLLMSFVMGLTVFPAQGYAQFFNDEEDPLSEETYIDENNEDTDIIEPDSTQDLESYEDGNIDQSTDDTQEPIGEEDQIDYEEQIDEVTEDPTEEIPDENIENLYSLTIHFIDKSSNNDISTLVYNDLQEGTMLDYTNDVNNKCKELEAMKYVKLDSDEVSGIIGDTIPLPQEDSNIDLYVYFEYRPFTVTFKYLLEDSNESIQEDKVENIPYGDYDFSKTEVPEIEGYEFVETKGNVTGTIEGDFTQIVTDEEAASKSLEVIFTYRKISDEPIPQPENEKYQVTFYYIDELTSNDIAKKEVYYLPCGEDIKYNPKEIKDYVYHHAVEVEYCDGSIDVYYFYGSAQSKGQYRVKINYLEENTNKVLAKQFVSVKVEDGFKYNVSCKDKLHIPGYKYVKTVGDTTGIINGKDVVINVYYKKVQQYTVTVNYIDYNTKKNIAKSFVSVKLNEGESYNVERCNALKIDGYKYYKTTGDLLKGTIDKNKVINVYYLKNGETAVNTGDYNNLLIWIAVGAVAIIAIVVITIKSRKK